MRFISILMGVMLFWADAGSARASGPADVLTQHNDAVRSGVTFGETILSPSTVGPQSVGKIATLPVDGRVFAQPLYVGGVQIPDAGTRNVLYVATEHDSLYAFDADSLDPTPLFMVTFGTAVPSSVTGCPDLTPEVGITSTPTIDTSSGLLYLEARTVDEGQQSQTLHAVDLRNGQDVLSPAVISGTVSVAGYPDVVFDPVMHNNRPGLVLSNGNVYVAFASLCDHTPYHGWIFSYSASTLLQQNVFVTTKVGQEGGIWMGGGGLVADSLGNIYASIGNGNMNLLDGGQDISMAMARWTPDLQLTDWFSPYNEATLSGQDLDVGPCPTMLLEDQALLIGGSKGVFGPGGSTLSNPIYVANSNGLGHQHLLDNDQLVQSIPTAMPVKYGWSGMATFPGPAGPQLFACGAGMPLTSYQLSGGQFSQIAANAELVAPADHEGAPMSISTSGPDAGPGVLWLLMALTDGDTNFEDPTSGVLRAFSTADVTTELWDSNMNAARDSVGNIAKFTSPTIANGRVFAATFAGVVDVYGLVTDGGSETGMDGGDAGEMAEDGGDSGVAEDGGHDGGDAGHDAGPDAGDAGLDSGPSGSTSSSSSTSTGGVPPPSPSGGSSCSNPGATAWWWAAVPLAAIWLRRRRGR